MFETIRTVHSCQDDGGIRVNHELVGQSASIQDHSARVPCLIKGEVPTKRFRTSLSFHCCSKRAPLYRSLRQLTPVY